MRGVSLRYALTGLLRGNTTRNDLNKLWTPLEVKIKRINGGIGNWDTTVAGFPNHTVHMTQDLDVEPICAWYQCLVRSG